MSAVVSREITVRDYLKVHVEITGDSDDLNSNRKNCVDMYTTMKDKN